MNFERYPGPAEKRSEAEPQTFETDNPEEAQYARDKSWVQWEAGRPGRSHFEKLTHKLSIADVLNDPKKAAVFLAVYAAGERPLPVYAGTDYSGESGDNLYADAAHILGSGRSLDEDERFRSFAKGIDPAAFTANLKAFEALARTIDTAEQYGEYVDPVTADEWRDENTSGMTYTIPKNLGRKHNPYL